MLNTEILKYWFCVKLLLYHKFLNNGLILQVANKIFYPKCSYLTWFWNITASSNWEALHALKKLYGSFSWMGFNCLKARATSRRQFTFYHQVPRNSWISSDLNFFSVLEKLQSCCLTETSQLSKYCLAKDISKPLTICIITQSKCH